MSDVRRLMLAVAIIAAGCGVRPPPPPLTPSPPVVRPVGTQPWVVPVPVCRITSPIPALKYLVRFGAEGYWTWEWFESLSGSWVPAPTSGVYGGGGDTMTVVTTFPFRVLYASPGGGPWQVASPVTAVEPTASC